MNLKRKINYISTLLLICVLLCACNSKSIAETTTKTKESSTAEVESSAESTETIKPEETTVMAESETEESTETTDNEDYSKFDRNNYIEVLKLVLEKGNNWNDLPLSDTFRKTYKPEEGVIERKDYILTYVYDEHKESFEDGQVRLEVLYEEPKYANSYFNVYFTVNDKEQLDTIEIKFDKEEEIRAEAPIQPVYIDKENYKIIVCIFVSGEEEREVEFAVTDKFRNYYKDYEGIGLLPNPDYKDIELLYDLCSYNEKKTVIDVLYDDKIIRYNVYYTADANARLDSITLEEDSVRDREPETESKAE